MPIDLSKPNETSERPPVAPKLNLSELPPDTVALNIFRVAQEYGPDPMTVLVSRKSYDMNRQLIEAAQRVSPDDLFVFESPLDNTGRKTVIHLTRVVGIVAFVNTNIVPVKT